MTYPTGYQNKGFKSHSKRTFDESKNYYRVFEEQGAPVTDFDPNEKSEIYEHHFRRFVQDFFDNYCSGNAFKITEATNNINNFSITGFDMAVDYEYNARTWVDNVPVILSESVDYTSQPITQSVLEPPASGTRTDYVYLDVYLKELDYTDDPDLKIDLEGFGVTTRLKAVWQVKVSNEEGPIHFYEDNDGLPHVTMLLAKIERDDTDNIIDSMITDMRVYTNISPSVQTFYSAPFTLADGYKLYLNVDGANYTATFNSADFTDISQATSVEVAKSINKQIPVVYAYESYNQDKVTIISRNHGIDSTMQVGFGSTNANAFLGFPTDEVQGKDGNLKPKFLSKTVLEEILANSSLFDDFITGVNGEGDTGNFTVAKDVQIKGGTNIEVVASQIDPITGKFEINLTSNPLQEIVGTNLVPVLNPSKIQLAAGSNIASINITEPNPNEALVTINAIAGGGGGGVILGAYGEEELLASSATEVSGNFRYTLSLLTVTDSSLLAVFVGGIKIKASDWNKVSDTLIDIVPSVQPSDGNEEVTFIYYGGGAGSGFISGVDVSGTSGTGATDVKTIVFENGDNISSVAVNEAVPDIGTVRVNALDQKVGTVIGTTGSINTVDTLDFSTSDVGVNVTKVGNSAKIKINATPPPAGVVKGESGYISRYDLTISGITFTQTYTNPPVIKFYENPGGREMINNYVVVTTTGCSAIQVGYFEYVSAPLSSFKWDFINRLDPFSGATGFYYSVVGV